jgi:hypothetical protein
MKHQFCRIIQNLLNFKTDSTYFCVLKLLVALKAKKCDELTKSDQKVLRLDSYFSTMAHGCNEHALNRLCMSRYVYSSFNCLSFMYGQHLKSECSPPPTCQCNVQEKNVCIKFCENFGKTMIKTYQWMQVGFRGATVSQSWLFEWSHHFKEG